MTVCEAKRSRQLEEENTRLKRMVAELSLGQADAQGCVIKVVGPAAKKAAVGHLIQTHGASERRVCRLLQLHRSVARYQRSSRTMVALFRVSVKLGEVQTVASIIMFSMSLIILS